MSAVDSVRCPFCKEVLPPLIPPLPPMDLSKVPECVRRKRLSRRLVEVASAGNHANGSCSAATGSEEWLTTVELARLVGRDREWVRRQILRRKLAAWRDWRGFWRIHVSEVRKIRRDLVLQQPGEM